MINKKNKEIDNKIQLTKAMGVTKEMTPKQVSERWVEWSNKYPDEKNKLSPAIIVSLDTLSMIINVYDTLMLVINSVQTAVIAAGKAYKAALAMLPGIGGVDGAKTAAEEGLATLKLAISEVVKKMYKLPQTIYDQLTNTKVDEGAIL